MLIAMLKWLGQLAVAIICAPTVPVVVALIVVVKFVADKIQGAQPTMRWIPAWLNTYDDTGPVQGMYETQVASVYASFGWYVKTWYWLGVRNQAYGLFNSMAPVLRYGDPSLTWQQSGKSLYAQQDGSNYFNLIWSGNWSASKCWTVRIGWKLFAVQAYLSGAKKCADPSINRPTFDCIVRPYSSGQVA